VATKKSHLPIALIVDLILVILFTIVGHYTHSHNFDPQGLMTTAWPFVASLVVAWLLTAVWDRPIAPLATGTGVWAITVLLGLVLRGVTGAGGEPGMVPVSFMIVATTLNLITLVGWRIIATAVSGGSGRKRGR
jgi:peptidoglycan/LPS O-acetylase OafA/YrhL